MVELDLRSLKARLGMNSLGCKTPAMVRRELWTYFLAYNLTRTVMAQAALEKGITPRQLSLVGAMQTLNEFRGQLVFVDAAGKKRCQEPFSIRKGSWHLFFP